MPIRILRTAMAAEGNRVSSLFCRLCSDSETTLDQPVAGLMLVRVSSCKVHSIDVAPGFGINLLHVAWGGCEAKLASASNTQLLANSHWPEGVA